MIIRSFRNTRGINFIWLVGVILLLHMSLFGLSQESRMEEMYRPLRFFTDSWNMTKDVILSVSAFSAGLVVLVQSLIFSTIINKNNFFPKPTLMPALMYAVICSIFQPFLLLSPALLCNFLLLIILNKIFSFYRNADILSPLFDIGFIIALGTFIYVPFWFILPVVFMSLIIFRTFSWREWFSIGIGSITPYLIAGTYFFWQGTLESEVSKFNNFYLAMPNELHMEQSDFLAAIPIFIVVFLSLNKIREAFLKNVVYVRKSLSWLSILMIVIVGTYIFDIQLKVTHLLLTAAPLSLLMAFYFNNATKPLFYETFFVLLLASIVILQIY